MKINHFLPIYAHDFVKNDHAYAGHKAHEDDVKVLVGKQFALQCRKRDDKYGENSNTQFTS